MNVPDTLSMKRLELPKKPTLKRVQSHLDAEKVLFNYSAYAYYEVLWKQDRYYCYARCYDDESESKPRIFVFEATEKGLMELLIFAFFGDVYVSERK